MSPGAKAFDTEGTGISNLETLRDYRLLASSRSNFQQSGNGLRSWRMRLSARSRSSSDLFPASAFALSTLLPMTLFPQGTRQYHLGRQSARSTTPLNCFVFAKCR